MYTPKLVSIVLVLLALILLAVAYSLRIYLWVRKCRVTKYSHSLPSTKHIIKSMYSESYNIGVICSYLKDSDFVNAKKILDSIEINQRKRILRELNVTKALLNYFT